MREGRGTRLARTQTTASHTRRTNLHVPPPPPSSISGSAPVVLPLSHTLGFSLLSPLYAESSEKDPREEKHSQSSVCVISAVDYNQLLFFVAANVLTGLVNMFVDTLHMHGCTAEPDYTLTVHVSASGYVCTARSTHRG